MFYKYEHPFCKVVTSVGMWLCFVEYIHEHLFCKVVTSVKNISTISIVMYEHPFCVTLVTLREHCITWGRFLCYRHDGVWRVYDIANFSTWGEKVVGSLNSRIIV